MAAYGKYLHILIFGMTLYLQVQASSEICSAEGNVSAPFQRCGHHPGGVNNLNCYGHHSSYKCTRGQECKSYKCTWNPGQHGTNSTYTLVVRQKTKNYCKTHHSIRLHYEPVILHRYHNVSVEVYENSETANCTKAVFHGLPKSLWYCEPPQNVTFHRHSGRLSVNVNWVKVDANVIKRFAVKYNVWGSSAWVEPLVESHNKTYCTIKHLNASLAYNVQIRCATNEKCSQCPWSQIYTVPAELVSSPVILDLTLVHLPEQRGQRLISATCTFPAELQSVGYQVTVGKLSGEATSPRMDLQRCEFRLILSHSAYQLNISANNSASVSPPLSLIIPEWEAVSDDEDRKLDVTVHNSTALSFRWKSDFETHVCYSVEWREGGRTAQYKSFYEKSENFKTLSPLPKPLEPYKKYTLTLHTRSKKPPCNLKNINNSESTYGSAQFYLLQGSPARAPSNVSNYNVTQSSAVLQWSFVPEEDGRGFLLGYVIYLSMDSQEAVGSEINITVPPNINSYKLQDLKSGAVYRLQMAAFTSGGVGVRSDAIFFKTNHKGGSNLSRFLIIFSGVMVTVVVGSVMLKRAKTVFWPNIPDPGNSNIVQKMGSSCQLDLLGAITVLTVEEWDTRSLQILEMDAMSHVSTPAVDHTPRSLNTWIQTDAVDESGDIFSDEETETFSRTHQTDGVVSTAAFPSGYTTMEMFQQMIPPVSQPHADTGQASKSLSERFTEVKSGSDYVRQFSTSSATDTEEMRAFL